MLTLPKCPKCGSKNAARIVYGLPSKESMEKESMEKMEDEENPKVVSGGCCVEDEKWSCNDCDFEW